MIKLKSLLTEASEEQLENKAREIRFSDGGKFDYIIVDKSLNINPTGNVAFITGVTSSKNSDMTPNRGTGILKRMVTWIKENQPNVKYVMGTPISNDAALAITKSFGVPVQRGKQFKIEIQQIK